MIPLRIAGTICREVPSLQSEFRGYLESWRLGRRRLALSASVRNLSAVCAFGAGQQEEVPAQGPDPAQVMQQALLAQQWQHMQQCAAQAQSFHAFQAAQAGQPNSMTCHEPQPQPPVLDAGGRPLPLRASMNICISGTAPGKKR